ncbi:MAG: aminotransferase class I/II-fold pyridoxal phosphate-dependent enzyme [Sciscionella sp.]
MPSWRGTAASGENPFPSAEMMSRASGVRPWARLSTNENEFGPAPEVLDAIAMAAAEANRYPDCEHFDLRTALAAEFGVRFEQVHVRTGIDGLLGDACRAFASGGTVVTTEGTYATFAYFARAAGATVETVPYRDLHVDTGALAERAGECGADIVYLAEPDNPTGTSVGASAVRGLRDALPERTVLLVDGAYAEYQAPGEWLAVADVLDRRVLWLRTFSKAYGLAGMRVGYTLGSVELLRGLRCVTEYYAVGRVAQQAALAAFTATGYRDRMLADTAAGREHYTDHLGGLGFTVLACATNFVTVRCGPGASAESLRAHLAEAGVFARAIPLDEHGLLRMTIGPAHQRDAVLKLLAERSDTLHRFGQRE